MHGQFLPIGQLVCSGCKEKHLKSVDFSSSQIYPLAHNGAQCETSPPSKTENKTDAAMHNREDGAVAAAAAAAAQPKISLKRQHSEGMFPIFFKVFPEKEIIILKRFSLIFCSFPGVPSTLPVAADVHSSEMAGSSSSPLAASAASPGNIFARIGRLNDALQSINPRYQPIGFSITSIESCSQRVLDDAVNATEMAVSTLLSVIGEFIY